MGNWNTPGTTIAQVQCFLACMNATVVNTSTQVFCGSDD